MRKDKKKVVDEVWTEEHIKSYLSVRPHDGSDEDFFMLLKAYRSMRPEDFAVFVDFFCAQQRNLNATDKEGSTVLAIIGNHRHGEPYARTLKKAGAV